MAKKVLPAGQWTEVVTTSVDTLFSSPFGRVKVTTTDPTATGYEDDSHTLNRFEAVVYGAGVTVWAYPDEILYGRSSAINYHAAGV